MLLSGVLFVLFLAGCWLYSLTDAALTPAKDYRGMPKATWIGIIAATFIVGAVAWLFVRRSWRTHSWPAEYPGRAALTDLSATDPMWHPYWTAADDAYARHPAGRSRDVTPGDFAVPKGPDDDAEFLRLLDRRLRGTSADAGE